MNRLTYAECRYLFKRDPNKAYFCKWRCQQYEKYLADLRKEETTECEKCLSQYACSHASPECDCEND